MATATRDKATARFEKIWAKAQQSQKTSVSQAQQSIKSEVSVSSSNYLPQHFAKGIAELADACLAQKLIDGTQHAELTHACDSQQRIFAAVDQNKLMAVLSSLDD